MLPTVDKIKELNDDLSTAFLIDEFEPDALPFLQESEKAYLSSKLASENE